MDIKLYKVIITDEAENDLNEIYEYIETKLYADKAARELIKKMKQKILALEDNPYSCPEVYTKPKHELYRKLTIKNYVVLYQVEEKNRHIVIYRIEYGMKDYLYFED